MRRRLVLALAVVLVVAGCSARPAPAPIGVGTGATPESTLVGQLYAAALRYYGSPAEVTPAENALSALDSGSVTVLPGFTGQLLETFAPGAPAHSDEQVYRDLLAALPEGVAAGDYTMSAQDKPAVAVTEATAAAWGGKDLSALRRNCAKVVPGAVRGSAVPAVVGTCRMPKPVEFADRAGLFAALAAGKINAAWTTTADPANPSAVVVLADRTAMIRAENLVPLYRRNALTERQILAINEVAGVLDTGSLADMRRQVAEGADPRAVADAFLQANPLGH
ncbi:glycine betaine ABC transporter substrate-binding protein [Mycobacterium sp. 141]|uniref:glycine betaine ABC transporter substrate-binding protein n=1 Tax=Mycobacterium sp. 141 TaxID=1120797 RepID=UPI0003A88D75|nr:glycine betaine ABC transporter substrate-binding protein [Mycobacterium sp. 141]